MHAVRSLTSAARAPAALLRLRPYSTAPATAPAAAASTPLAHEQDPSPAPVAPLPGSAVLPDAFRVRPSTSTSSSSTSPTPTPATPAGGWVQAGDFLAHRNSRSGAIPHRLTQPYRLHVYSTRNNTILTLSLSASASSTGATSPLEHPVAWVSAGSAGYKGAARGTYDAAVEVTLRMFRKLANLIDPPVLPGGQRVKAAGPPPTELEIVWTGFGQGRDAVFRTLMGAEGDTVRGLVRRVTDATPLKMGGTRPKKRRVI